MERTILSEGGFSKRIFDSLSGCDSSLGDNNWLKKLKAWHEDF